MMLDELVSKNDSLKKSFKEKPTVQELCAGCDVRVGEHGQYWTNGKQYCYRCYNEIKALYDWKEVRE
jgi:hypothetical protein